MRITNFIKKFSVNNIIYKKCNIFFLQKSKLFTHNKSALSWFISNNKQASIKYFKTLNNELFIIYVLHTIIFFSIIFYNFL